MVASGEKMSQECVPEIRAGSVVFLQGQAFVNLIKVYLITKALKGLTCVKFTLRLCNAAIKSDVSQLLLAFHRDFNQLL